MQITKFEEGFYDLYLLVLEGTAPVREYLHGLDEDVQKKFFNRFKRILEHGPPTNEEQFRNLGDKIYEIKVHTGPGHRILCFFAGPALPRTLILTHGFPKPGSKKALRHEKETAMSWRDLDNIEIVDLEERS
jgi:phage-related protein